MLSDPSSFNSGGISGGVDFSESAIADSVFSSIDCFSGSAGFSISVFSSSGCGFVSFFGCSTSSICLLNEFINSVVASLEVPFSVAIFSFIVDANELLSSSAVVLSFSNVAFAISNASVFQLSAGVFVSLFHKAPFSDSFFAWSCQFCNTFSASSDGFFVSSVAGVSEIVVSDLLISDVACSSCA